MKEVKKQKQYAALLAQTFLFNETDGGLVELAFQDAECRCMEFDSGEPVYTRSHFSTSMGLVLSGKLTAYKPSEDGSGLPMNTFYPGGIFGVAGLFHQTKRYVSEVKALKRSRVLFLSQGLLQRLFQQDYRIAENYIAFLSSRICYLNSRIDHFTGGNARRRLSSFLLSISERSADPLKFELPGTLTQLAGTLDMGRASLYRAMDSLEQEGILRRSGKTIVLIDLERLKSGAL